MNRVALALLLFAAPLHAQDAWLSGRVESVSGEAVGGATVRAEGPASAMAVTANDGSWRLGPLAPGSYLLTVEHLGYAPLERDVRVPFDDALLLVVSERPLSLDALVVTAGRRLQRLADAPVATEVVTSREIRETGAADVAAVLTERTGLELQGGHPAGSGVMIQGMGSERVLVLLDGQPFIGRMSGAIDVSRIPTAMVQRVEVVKGPQSTLYGSDAMGGVVNVITRPLDAAAWSTSLSATAGDQGRLDVSAHAMGGRGPVAGAVDVGHRSVELAPGLPGASGALAERWDGAGKLSWRTPVDGLRLEASGVLLVEDQRWRSGQLYDFVDNTQWSARTAGILERGAHRFSSSVYITAFDHLARTATSERPVSAEGEEETQRLAEAELVYGFAAGAIAVDVGVEARREALTSERIAGGDRDEDTYEAFAQSSFGIGPVTLVPGVRASWSDPWGTHWTPRVAAMVRPVPELAVRVSAGQGFRAPAFKERFMEFLNVGPGFGYTVRGNPDLQPEVSRNLTASLEWAGARTYARVQAFTNSFDDFIETQAVGDSSGITVFTYGNIDNGWTRGGELEVGGVLGACRAELGYSLLRTKNEATGEALLGRPEHSLRGTLTWAHSSGWRFSATGVRTGRTAMARSDEGTEWRDPFARFDLRAAYSLPGGFELAAGVDNVFDTRVNDWPGFTGRHLYTTISWRAVHDR